MMRALIIYLEAPMLSFGDAPGNAMRGTRTRPTRSALLGLAGAALGILREDAAGQGALAASFATGSATLNPGAMLTDFHTFQSLPSAKGRNIATRAEALARARDLTTSITRRDYRTDARHLAGYRLKDGATLTLDALAGAFARPHFALWLGRKSCPLSHPLAAAIVEADTLAEAMMAYGGVIETRGHPASSITEIAVAETDDIPSGIPHPRIDTIVDEPLDRSAWHFAARADHVFSPQRVPS